MTLEGIFNDSSNASEQLKKAFTLRAYKSKVNNVNFETEYFLNRIEDSVLRIADGSLNRFGLYDCCCKCSDGGISPATPENKKIPEELKPELFKILKDSVFAALNKYKSDLDDLFGGNEAKTEVKVEVEKQPEQPDQALTSTAFTSANTEEAQDSEM